MESLNYIILVILLMYYIHKIGDIKIDKKLVIILSLTSYLLLFISSLISIGYITIFFILLLLIGYAGFYGQQPFVLQYKYYLILLITFPILFYLFKTNLITSSTLLLLIELFLLIHLSFKARKLVSLWNLIIVIIFVLLIFNKQQLISILLSTLVFIILEYGFNSYKKQCDQNTNSLVDSIISSQYEEIKSIYLNMRGFRHDYHSHIQAIKAHVCNNQINELTSYLNQLETDLTSIDSYIKSGNVMIDAILNSKLTIAQNNDIPFSCKAICPDYLTIKETDLCVILGNALDNAIEACIIDDRVDKFLRIYIAVNKQQLYISIQNSAIKQMNFNQKNYISSKKGNHGLGLKRLKHTINKYDGYLNLQNEEGVFATEVTLPL